MDENTSSTGACPDTATLDLARWDDDFSDAPIEDRDYESIPDGKYQVIVDRVELTKSQNSDNTILKWKLKVLGPTHAGALLWRNNVIATKTNVKWLKNDLHVCGLDLDKLSSLPASMERLLDIRLEVTKKTRGENENVYINRRLVSDTGQAPDDVDRRLQEEADKVF